LRRQNDAYLKLGDPIAFEHADDVAWEMEQGSICGLGMGAAKPLESARLHFPDHFKTKQLSLHRAINEVVKVES